MMPIIEFFADGEPQVDQKEHIKLRKEVANYILIDGMLYKNKLLVAFTHLLNTHRSRLCISQDS